MTRFVSLPGNLFLVEQVVEVPKPEAPVKGVLPVGTNHIWEADRSGSMYGVIRQLCEDLITRYDEIPEGDTISFGWFSGRGEHRFVIKGYKVVHTPKDRETFAKLMRSCASTVGLTCFSEILFETQQVIEDLAAISPAFSLMFLTDGYPCPETEQEHRGIWNAIEALKGKVMASLFVGYGNYYNKQLMASMAAQIGGSLVHAHDLQGFKLEMANFEEGIKDLDPRIEVTLNHIPMADIVFSVQNRSVVAYKPNQGKVLFSPSKAKLNAIYMLDINPPKDGKEIKLTDSALTSGAAMEPMIKAVYGAALMLSQKCNVPAALDTLGVLGDVALIDSINSAFTNDEYGRAESLISDAMVGPKSRLKKGRKLGYLPDPNAFCLMDMLDILNSDEETYIWPRHKAFNYNYIGTKNEVLDGTAKFNADPTVKCSIADLVWNESKLNLSFRVNIPGTITLPATPEELKKMGLQAEFPTYIWRTYTVVKDGFINLACLPVSVSENVFNQLQAHGLFEGQTWTDGTEPNILDLNVVPVMNRAIAGRNTSAKDLCLLTSREALLSGKLSAYRARVKEITPPVSYPKRAILSEETMIYLEGLGIKKDGAFNPQVGRDILTGDFYEAKEFEIFIKGAKSSPKVADVQAKVAAHAAYVPGGKEKAPKPITPREQPIADALKEIAGLFDPSIEIELVNLKKQMDIYQKELKLIRRTIRETMFAMILGKYWFSEFNSREDCTLDLDGQTFVISLKTVTVNL
jgi:hypothetical protein